MRTLDYVRAADRGDALARLRGMPDAVILAGGTEMTNWIRDGLIDPGCLIDIRGLPEREVAVGSDGALHLGALARMAAVARHPGVVAGWPALAEALLAGASPQIRNAATVGGNLMQRTRCPYFRDLETACNKRDPGSGCPARTGLNRWHAILGASGACVAVHPSDLAVALAALDATVEIDGPEGARTEAARDFHRLPGETPWIETRLRPGELITGIRVPGGPAARRSAYVKVRDRASFEFAIVSAAVALELRDGLVARVGIALGGVAHRPWRCDAAEARLVGLPLDDATIAGAADAAVEGAIPLSDNAFKIDLAHAAVRRALERAGDAA